MSVWLGLIWRNLKLKHYPRRAVDVERFDIDQPETPEQRRARLQTGQQNAAAFQSRLAEFDAREDQRMRRLSQRGSTNMLTMNDLMGDMGGVPLSRSDVMLPGMNDGQQFLTEEFPTNHDDMIMEDMYRNQQRRPIQQYTQEPAKRVTASPEPIRGPHENTRQMLTENKPIRPPIHEAIQTSENWKVKQYLGETRNGTEVEVWKVENVKTKSSLRNLFRLESVASRIAICLNESGDSNDPRVVSLVNAYEKRDKLIKEARALEQSANGKAMKTDRLRELRAQINQLDYRLGV